MLTFLLPQDMAAGSGWFEETLKKSEHPEAMIPGLETFEEICFSKRSNDYYDIMNHSLRHVYSDKRLFLASKFLPYFLKVTVLVKSHVAPTVQGIFA